jgi:integrase/recombinase XerD
LCLLADTGVRVTEALTLKLENIDWDNLLIKVVGKRKKDRIVPMSIELRKVLHRYVTRQRYSRFPSPYLLCNSTGTAWDYYNAFREFVWLFKKLGIEGFDSAFHSFRRFFGKNYLKNGGNLVYLQRLFGHSDIATTKMYLEDIDTADLHAMHLRTSPLSRLKS